MKQGWTVLVAVVLLLLAASPVAAQGEGTIPQVAAGNPELETLVTAVQAAGLEAALQADGPYTVFAPTDEAFAALPADQLNALLADPAMLAQVVEYHVVEGQVAASDVAGLDGQSVTASNGESLQVTVADDIKVNDASVIQTDIAASNGVIHVIDTVLIPPSLQPAQEAPAGATNNAATTAPSAGPPTVAPTTGVEDAAWTSALLMSAGVALMVASFGLFYYRRSRIL